jgi:hypothetical protein
VLLASSAIYLPTISCREGKLGLNIYLVCNIVREPIQPLIKPLS